VRDAVEWIARLAVLFSGGSCSAPLAANAGPQQRRRGAGLSGLRDALLAAWQSDVRVWVHVGAVVAGLVTIAVAASPLPGARTRPGVYLASALAEPLRDFFARHRSTGTLVLALICLYRIPDFVLNIMNPFYLDLGYTLVEIAEVRKIFGVAMTMFGVFVGGVAVARYGLLRAMVIGAFAGPLSNLLFIWLALQEHNLWACLPRSASTTWPAALPARASSPTCRA
jgi:PAT family beta-lactamase induction signal transducer AmpG